MNVTADIQKLLGENAFEFYRCYRCHELISAMQMAVALNTNGLVCGCGSMKVQPSQVKVAEYPNMNVIEMANHLGFTENDYIEDFLSEGGEPKHVELIRRRFAEVRSLCS